MNYLSIRLQLPSIICLNFGWNIGFLQLISYYNHETQWCTCNYIAMPYLFLRMAFKNTHPFNNKIINDRLSTKQNNNNNK